MNGKKLSKKWLYTFIGIAFVALATCTAALYYKEYIIATGTGLVFGAQVINIIKWKRENTVSKRKTGIYSGSFNPVHIGHLALANWLCEFTELDELWFLITPHNPLKEKEELMDDRLRYELVKKSIAGYPKFHASDFEFSLPQPTYTINTLRTLEASYPDREFYFIMGADNWKYITRWVEYEAIISNYPIFIYPRKGFDVEIPAQYPHIKKVDAPLVEISSTFIREAFKTGKDVRFFLPEAIRNLPFPLQNNTF